MPTPSTPTGGRPARLALADGSVFHGMAFGATTGERCVAAEVVFNTAMCGYQEALTDPSYAGQILTMTVPQVGNTGVNTEDMESTRVHPQAFVVRELARTHSNYRSNQSLSDFLARQGVLGITGIDTRALTRRLRSEGVMTGVASDDASMSDAELVEQARVAPAMLGRDLVSEVASTDAGVWTEDLGEWGGRATSAPAGKPVVLAIDCGAKSNILRHLVDRGCVVERVPHSFAASAILERFNDGSAQGLFLSNGPGDPAALESTVGMVSEVIAKVDPQVPVFGICLGHQLLAQAVGARTYKLPFGHRGANHPVRNEVTGRVEITSQNHGFAVDPASIDASKIRITHTHLNDQTVAGLEILGRLVFSVQHHPEASPGPHDAWYLFDRFVEGCRGRLVSGV